MGTNVKLLREQALASIAKKQAIASREACNEARWAGWKRIRVVHQNNEVTGDRHIVGFPPNSSELTTFKVLSVRS